MTHYKQAEKLLERKKTEKAAMLIKQKQTQKRDRKYPICQTLSGKLT
jgi:hypothetical protein